MKIEEVKAKRTFVLTLEEPLVEKLLGALNGIYSLPDEIGEFVAQLIDNHGVEAVGEIYLDVDGDPAYRNEAEDDND
jgi:hypothetical protein